MPPRHKLLACEVMRDEIEWLLREAGTAADYDAVWLEMGLHERPERLADELRRQIAAAAGHEVILLMFGLCSNAIVGLSPPPGSILVIPRVHDCISIYLGSGALYHKEQAEEAGTYWFSRGFLHRSDGGSPDMSGPGAGSALWEEGGKRMTLAEMRAEFIERYGEENAEYLMETLAESWKRNYRRAVYLHWNGSPEAEAEADRRRVAAYAAENNWTCEERPVDLRLLRSLLFGPWTGEEFAVARPGQCFAATHDAFALRAEPLPAGPEGA